MSFCLPCRNNPAFRLGHICVYHRDLDAVRYANRVHASLAIIIAIIDAFKRGAFEDSNSVFESDIVIGYVAAFFPDPKCISRLHIYIMYLRRAVRKVVAACSTKLLAPA
jgi:hypothetical protein